MKKPTLEEVAKLAGVSRATVSRVVNNFGNVKPEYRERVQKVIAETGYRPNFAARSLVSQRSNIVGLVIPSLVQTVFLDPYFPALIESISQACNDKDYTMSLFLFRSREEQQHIYDRVLGTGLIDGLIGAVDTIEDPFITRLIETKIPFVYIGRPQNAEQIHYVDVDNVAGSYTATCHLIHLGYRRIATIAAPADTNVGIDRRAGYERALRENGITIDEKLIACGDFTRESGYRAMCQLLPLRPDALFIASDTMALGASQAIYEAKLRIPEDIALVGFDDLPPAQVAVPPLTTIRQPVRRLGTLAVETLSEVLNRRLETPRHTILPTELIIRSSCGAVKRAN